MALNIDSHMVDIPCPKCGHKLKESLGRLKNDPHLVCGGCGQKIAIDAKQFRDKMRSIDEALKKLTRR